MNTEKSFSKFKTSLTRKDKSPFSTVDLKTILKLLFESFFKRKGRIISLVALPLVLCLVVTIIINLTVFPNYSGDADQARYIVTAAGGISNLMSLVFVPIFLITIGVFLTSFKESHLFKRIMISRVNKREILLAFWIFTLTFMLGGFLYFTILNTQWIVILSTYVSPYYNPDTGIFQVDNFLLGGTTSTFSSNDPIFKNALISSVTNPGSESKLTFSPSLFNTFNLGSYFVMGLIFSFSLSAVQLLLVGISKKQSTYTVSFLGLVFIFPFVYTLIGGALFDDLDGTGKAPVWFDIIYPINTTAIGNWFTTNLFTTNFDATYSFNGVSNQVFETPESLKNLFLVLVINGALIPVYIYAGYKLWNWKES